MKVSVMLTCYNIADYIDISIESVVTQYMPFEWEMLIGDDGSDDGTYEKVLSWQKKYPKMITVYQMSRDGVVEKTGYRAARNRANLLKHASGDYLIFLDGDDQFTDSNKISTQVSYLEKDEFRACACCAHNIMVHYLKNGEKKPMIEKSLGNKVVSSKDYWRDYYFHPNTILFRNSCIPLMLDPVYCDYLNDNFLTYLILQQGGVLYLDKTMAQYNITGQGLWTGNKRTYGVFRNLKAYDLERRVNHKMRRVAFMRHVSDFNYAFHNYNSEEKVLVSSLFKDVDISNFPISFLLYKKEDYSIVEKLQLLALRMKTIVVLRYCQIRARIRE